MRIPLTRPSPPKLSSAAAELASIEESGIYSNFGPVNTQFEQEMLARFFDGQGACLTVCNATIGLMLAIKEAAPDSAGSFAVMPSFTFAAAAHAAFWCGLRPLLCDIDAANWAADPAAESMILQRYAGNVGVVVPYATFGYPIDLGRYAKITAQSGVPVVVDAAASLGTIDTHGRGFGTGFSGAIVFSMHATKSFATGEGGLIYSADRDRIARLRAMSSFGFGAPRTATMPGLNAKLSEVGALLGTLRLADYDRITAHRSDLLQHYRDALPELSFQSRVRGQQAHQFVPALLPSDLSECRAAIVAEMAERGITTATYFSPHLFEQPYFKQHCVAGPLPVCDEISARIISLPLFDTMTHHEVDRVAKNLREVLAGVGESTGQELHTSQRAQASYGALGRAS